jgi:hypothetical protein
MAFHSQHATLGVAQQQTLLTELFQQRLNLVVLELDNSPLAFVSPANEGGKQNVVELENDLPWKLGRAKEKRPASMSVGAGILVAFATSSRTRSTSSVCSVASRCRSASATAS